MMNVLKIILGVVLLLALVLVGGGMFLSSKFSVSRSVVVNAPAEKVYPLVASPRQWKAWSVWNRRDPAMQIDYSGPESGAGAVWAWHSKSQGDGKMTFTAAEANQRLAYDLFFPDFGTTSTGELRLTPEGNGTRITWVMNGDMGSNPLFRWIALNADKMVGEDFDGGLANLKTLAEKP
ncbi:MAG: SRPBCC family protein [Burkholderiales bacterium]|nr:SRPBCC family protein [Burkholderiales bacterium]